MVPSKENLILVLKHLSEIYEDVPSMTEGEVSQYDINYIASQIREYCIVESSNPQLKVIEGEGKPVLPPLPPNLAA